MPSFFKNPIVLYSAIAVILIIIAAIFLYIDFFSAPQKNAEPEKFIVDLSTNTGAAISQLKSSGFIRNGLVFRLALWLNGKYQIESGGYKVSKALNVWQMARVFSQPEYMKWVIIPEGLRKEETADILAKTLNWTDVEKEKWITVDTALNYDYAEGVYFPNTYLIPVDEKPADIAQRLRAKFEEKFSPYSQEAAKQNIKWTTILKLASIIQKEAAGEKDMSIISGILWNRLDKNMRLEVDVTLQYMKGNAKIGWWPVLKTKDKQTDSPYNTYKYYGLPPHPISNPGLDAISSALNPQKTNCLYYIHDASRQIHCSATYAQHQANIEKYLQ